MTGQQSIPVPPAPTSGPCAWCGVSTSLRLDLQRGATLKRGIRVPKWAWVCPAHNASIQRREVGS